MIWWLACSTPTPPTPGGLLLVTLDTTRADALGAYGGPATPIFDGLAADGLRFDLALAHAPTTLSSHVSMFSGLDPHGHRVPRNGFPVPPDVDLVAERFAAEGWHTVAVVGSSALDGDLGLARGFAVYDDDLARDAGRRHEDYGERVTERALRAVAGWDRSAPMLLWVHYFDAHSPYAPPNEHATRLAQPTTFDAAQRATVRAEYAREIAYQDAQLGRLLAGLTEAGWSPDATVIAGDHGEMFWEEPERPVGHGTEVDLVVTRVPLVVHGRGAGVVDGAVAVSEIAATLEQLAGLGRGGLLGERTPGPIYLEATRPDLGGPGWNNLACERGVYWEGRFATRFPLLEAGGRPPQSDDAELLALLAAWDAEAPARVVDTRDEATLEGLRALGYAD